MEALLERLARKQFYETEALIRLHELLLFVRAYPHNAVVARLAEAQEWSLASAVERELDQRWTRNVMLNKWLEYCLERGHHFSSATELPAAP